MRAIKIKQSKSKYNTIKNSVVGCMVILKKIYYFLFKSQVIAGNEETWAILKTYT